MVKLTTLSRTGRNSFGSEYYVVLLDFLDILYNEKFKLIGNSVF